MRLRNRNKSVSSNMIIILSRGNSCNCSSCILDADALIQCWRTRSQKMISHQPALNGNQNEVPFIIL